MYVAVRTNSEFLPTLLKFPSIDSLLNLNS
uniref:Uncharacterized protein n=1 Tax=Arundo donax TaxID=35708 RepID=A0A0A9B2Z3_ARUDO